MSRAQQIIEMYKAVQVTGSFTPDDKERLYVELQKYPYWKAGIDYEVAPDNTFVINNDKMALDSEVLSLLASYGLRVQKATPEVTTGA